MIDLPISPVPTQIVRVPVFFGLKMPPGTDLILLLLIVAVCFWGLLRFGYEFYDKWQQYRDRKP